MTNELRQWLVFLRDERGNLVDLCRQAALSRKAAKEQAAQLWGLTSMDRLIVVVDRRACVILT